MNQTLKAMLCEDSYLWRCFLLSMSFACEAKREQPTSFHIEFEENTSEVKRCQLFVHELELLRGSRVDYPRNVL